MSQFGQLKIGSKSFPKEIPSCYAKRFRTTIHCEFWNKCINLFCFVCGQFTPKKNAARISPQILNVHNLYLGIDAKEEMSKSWAPNVICAACVRYLKAWLNGTKKSMSYAVPMIWRKHTNHVTDCYFCQTNLTGYSIRTRQNIRFPNVKSVTKPVPHTKNMFCFIISIL